MRAHLAPGVVDHHHRRGRAGAAEGLLRSPLRRALQSLSSVVLTCRPPSKARRRRTFDELLADHVAKYRRLRLDRGGTTSRAASSAAGVVEFLAVILSCSASSRVQVAARERGLRVGDRVVGAGVRDDAGQQGRLAAVSSRRSAAVLAAARWLVPPEVDAGRRLDPIGAVPESDRLQVLAEDLLLRPLAGEVVRERRLAELLETVRFLCAWRRSSRTAG